MSNSEEPTSMVSLERVSLFGPVFVGFADWALGSNEKTACVCLQGLAISLIVWLLCQRLFLLRDKPASPVGLLHECSE